MRLEAVPSKIEKEVVMFMPTVYTTYPDNLLLQVKDEEKEEELEWFKNEPKRQILVNMGQKTKAIRIKKSRKISSILDEMFPTVET